MGSDTQGEAAPPQSRTSDLGAFLRALFRGERFVPDVKIFAASVRTRPQEPEEWLTYYGYCVQYITSLHNQFIATLSIQGALAIGCLAALDSILDSSNGTGLAAILGLSGCIMETALTWIAVKLFRQHCVTCWMLARLEQEQLGLPTWAGIKALLGTEGSRLFTSPSVFVLTIAYGLCLAAGLALGGLAGG